MECPDGRRWQAYQKICGGSDTQSSTPYQGTFDAKTYLAIQNAIKAPKIAAKRKSLGIQIGEITAWRCWKMTNGTLCSAFAENIWYPNEPFKSFNGVNDKGKAGVGQGIHAFKSQWRAIRWASLCGSNMVIGKVSLWGEIVEFENGWHAEYGKIHSLHSISTFWMFYFIFGCTLLMPNLSAGFFYPSFIIFAIITIIIYTIQYFKLKKYRKIYGV